MILPIEGIYYSLYPENQQIFAMVSADIYKQNDAVDIKVPCYDSNAALCPSTTLCNISINYPNGTAFITDAKMSNKLSTYNYTLTSTKIIGEYNVYVYCADGSDYDYNSFTFEITKTGEQRLKEGEGTIIFTLILSMIIIGIFFTVIGFTFKENWAGKLIFFSLASLCFISVVMYGLVISESTLGIFNNLSEGYSTFWVMIKTLIGIFILALLIFSFFIIFKIYKKKRGLED